jgi:hypothetical protein
MNLQSYAHLIFDKAPKSIQWRKDNLLNKCCWEKWLSACRKLKLDPCLSPCTTINSKWIKDLNIRLETLKLVQETAGSTLETIRIGKDFLSRTPAAQQLRDLPYAPAIPLLGIYLKECNSSYYKGTCTSTFSSALFIIVKL